ncbi:MAG: urease accessory protein UreG, partial [Streptococcus salivarius]
TDLAPYVGANLDRMREDTLHFRNEDSFIFTNLNNDDNVKEVEEWIRKNFLLEDL